MHNIFLGQYSDLFQRGKYDGHVDMQDLEGAAYFLAVTQMFLLIATLAAMMQNSTHMGGYLFVGIILQVALILSYMESSG